MTTRISNTHMQRALRRHWENGGECFNDCSRSCSKVDMIKKVFQGRDGLQLVFSGPRECTDILEETELSGNTRFSPHLIVYVRP